MLQPLTYIGRQASRSDGQARRKAILEATLKVIVAEGIRGVRHRAVATMAGVPLASTTYYFADIKELIHDALTYYAEKAMAANLALEQQSFAALGGFDATSLREPAVRRQLCDVLTGFICGHIKGQVADRDERILELAFNEEALRNPALADAIVRLDDAILSPVSGFFCQLGATESQAQAFALEVIALIRFLEFRNSVRSWMNEPECEAAVRSQLTRMLAQVAAMA
ncbi:TetR family transcriptional regulator [Shewanella sp. JM162201]|uniref:TetR family transcriptional regulator n=1 Tax=Shewanella jiangmenensis TaxID=2837387 RepID=A0ABS5V5L3_9GAMM|nr:TetR family transcriptional regulator [Shewanella jiangmenensis]MBT1445750.1 TetR family transcriptional regulator [Shewanella jiangmenensis]